MWKWMWKLFWKLDCLTVLNRSWTVYKRWVTSSWATKELASCIQSLPQSWSGMLSDLVHQKTKRGVWKLFWNLGCLAAQNRSWTVYKRWVTDNWPTMVLASPIKSLPQSWPGMLRLGPPKTKRSVWKLFWKLDCLIALNWSWTLYKRWVTNFNLEWSQLHSLSLFLSLHLGC